MHIGTFYLQWVDAPDAVFVAPMRELKFYASFDSFKMTK